MKSPEYRRRLSERRNARYASDPDYRLAVINAGRVRRGAEPLRDLSEVGLSLIAYASKRRRGDGGRFA